MLQTISHIRRYFSSSSVKESVAVWGAVAAIVVAGFTITYHYAGAPPPRVIRIATAMTSGAYYQFGLEYAACSHATASR